MQSEALMAKAVIEEAAGGGNRWLAAGLALVVAVLCVRIFWQVRGSTLAAPALWAVAACLAMSAAEASLAARPALESTLGGSLMLYAARVGSVCPMMAVLGAKRPQDRGWQWVVLSLWVVLLVPAAQAWAAPSGDRLQLHPLWLYMVMLLVSLGPLNYLATSWGLNSLVVAVAQFYLLVSSALIGVESSRLEAPYIGLLIAALLPALPWRLAKAPAPTGPLEPLSARWRAFRNGWGAFWALRILNRVNESARLGQWPVRLEWHGFTLVENRREVEADGEVESLVQQTLDSLLRRFEGGKMGMTNFRMTNDE